MFNKMTTIVVCKLTHHAGFFSVFFFLVKAYIFAKKENFPFYIEDEAWPYRYNKGWHDYFKSLNIFDSNVEHTHIIYYGHPFSVGADFESNPITKLEFTIHDYIEAIHEIFILNDELIQKANTYTNSINGAKFVSLFVRRGDKITSGESPFFSTSNIVQCTNLDQYQNIFVQSDTFDAVNEIKNLFPKSNIYFTVSENKRGSHHYTYFYMTPNQIKSDVEEVLVGLFICLQAEECWTDDFSNVGRFLKLASVEKVKLYPLKIEDYNVGVYKNDKLNLLAKIGCPAYTNFNNSIQKE